MEFNSNMVILNNGKEYKLFWYVLESLKRINMVSGSGISYVKNEVEININMKIEDLYLEEYKGEYVIKSKRINDCRIEFYGVISNIILEVEKAEKLIMGMVCFKDSELVLWFNIMRENNND